MLAKIGAGSSPDPGEMRGVPAFSQRQERTIVGSTPRWDLEARHDGPDTARSHDNIRRVAMSVQAQGPTGAGYEDYEDSERGYGWVAFAGLLLLVVGTINFIEGIAAIGNAHFFVRNTNYILGSLNTWGWVALCIGIIQLLVGLGVFAKNQFARWTGVVILSINAVTQLLMMPAYPFWSLCIFTLDILAIYGLIAYGQHITD
jgi:hypothetical protein